MYYVKYFNGANDLSDPLPQGIYIIIGFHLVWRNLPCS